ncbi:MAG: gamma-glutamyltransferase [Gammaproteobacteria bacterium]
MKRRGAVAAGHALTADAAAAMLEEGGNAFDAALAAFFTACVVEPVLCALGGGGFLVAAPEDSRPLAYDFFTQTPRFKRPADELDFWPVHADFGVTTQEFHIGLGSIATPGCVKGVAAIHRDLCTVPLRELCQPAVQHAREGFAMTPFQADLLNVVKPIYVVAPEVKAVYAPSDSGKLLAVGDTMRQAELGETIDILCIEGEELFYRGEIARIIDEESRQGGGHLRRADLEQYAVHRRAPLRVRYRDAQLAINPPPSAGGILVAFALGLLETRAVGATAFGSPAHIELLSDVMALSNKARIDEQARNDEGGIDERRMLAPHFIERYSQMVAGRAHAARGTTHISVADSAGNIAAMTISNGEGCGSLLPGTGVMLNNMLGEEDLNPGGFHQWKPDQRMSSMMAPAVLMHADGGAVALGSGGSNRIRTAILQVVSNLIDFGMDVEAAVTSPRIHFEKDTLSIEGGDDWERLHEFLAGLPDRNVFPGLNVFFGGAHVVQKDARGFHGCGDPRRGGVYREV